MTDRRKNTETRDRYDELAASWHEAVSRLDRRYRKVVIAVMVAGAVALGAVALGVSLLRSTNKDANQTTTALCALRADLERRVDSGEAFLAEHPEGFADIPALTIRKGIADQKRTIRALSGLDCQ